MMAKFIDSLPKNKTIEELIEDDFITAHKVAKYKIGLDIVKNNFLNNPNNVEYYLSSSGDKTVLTLDEYEEVMIMVESINKNERARNIFFASSKNIEVRFQVPLF
jgi:hypothetical protein